MATYLELLGAANNDGIRQRMRIAVCISAEAIRNEAPATPLHAERLAWAKRVYGNPEAVANEVIWSVLAQNAAVPLNDILTVTDPVLQTAVNSAVNVFV